MTSRQPDDEVRDVSLLELEVDPYRGGFEIREQGRVVAMIAGVSRGGPKLAEPHQLIEGEHPFDPAGARCGAAGFSYDQDQRLLTIRSNELVVRVRLEQAPTVLRVVFADFK